MAFSIYSFPLAIPYSRYSFPFAIPVSFSSTLPCITIHLSHLRKKDFLFNSKLSLYFKLTGKYNFNCKNLQVRYLRF